MLDDLIELVLEIVIELFTEVLFPAMPRPVRIFLTCTILIALFTGSGLLIGFGMAGETIWQIGLGIAILVATIIWFVYLIRKYRLKQRLLGEC
jgi:hypothetical protein